ncbi:LytR/AlgR family response regulator transcription factor [Larkinella soli]|uniref:LytR/AlgR family response regulator transcription factor n=1 Tax=Larkinella soli TaxID=1770527 RepID=UPI000FFCB0D3|nr:LytTR family DNA-binding domain-containing protein [Larkinella soli]
MKKAACLIVDDEPIARAIIETYCRHLPQLTVAACCDNALDAKTELQKQPIDILFLDINMPVLNGLAFVKTLKNQPQIIFTTAYKEYAVDAFDLAACDYLLKPFSLERFIVAVDKALERLQPSPAVVSPVGEPKKEETIFLKTDGKIYKINLDGILFAEASGNYTKIILSSGMLVPGMTFTGFLELLPSDQFLRIHRSFVVNRTRISHIEGNRVFVGSYEIPIGTTYREAFLKQLGV